MLKKPLKSSVALDIMLLKLIRFLIICLLLVVLLYICQYLYAAKDKGQPTDLGVGLMSLGAPMIAAGNNPHEPMMKLVAVTAGPQACRWQNFEQLWGRCATAHVDVLAGPDLKIDAVSRRVESLMILLAHPCAASAWTSPEILSMLPCGSTLRPYRVTVISRLVAPGRGGIDNSLHPSTWNRVIIRQISVESLAGAF